MKELNLTEEVGSMNVSIMDSPPVVGAQLSSSFAIPGRGHFHGCLDRSWAGVATRPAWIIAFARSKKWAKCMQLPVLGVLPYFGDGPRSYPGRPVGCLSPRSMAAETVRTLRTAIHFGLGGCTFQNFLHHLAVAGRRKIDRRQQLGDRHGAGRAARAVDRRGSPQTDPARDFRRRVRSADWDRCWLNGGPLRRPSSRP